MQRITLTQEEIPLAQEKIRSDLRFEKKDFIPGYGFYNYGRRLIGANNFREFIDLTERKIKTTKPLEQILSFGTADWPENEELKGDLIWVAAKNALMAGYHYVTLINIVSGLYYATHLLTQNS